MGLYIHSIGELPAEAYRSYYVYLLDYGWDDTFGDAVRRNLPRMADAASRSDAVVIHGPRGLHFEDEVLSWHHINGAPAGDILPAILVTTRHPRTFREVFGPGAAFPTPADALLLIPLRRVCKTPDDVVALIDHLFRDVAAKKALSGFTVAKEMRRGVGPAIVDALVVQPKVAGIGIDLRKLASFFQGGRHR
ncbi:MAG: hypothetical protein ACLQGV_20545 [Bryobacteraceae bacterium]